MQTHKHIKKNNFFKVSRIRKDFDQISKSKVNETFNLDNWIPWPKVMGIKNLYKQKKNKEERQ